MRKNYALLAGAAALGLTLTACGEKPAGESASTSAASSEAAMTEAPAAEPAPVAEPAPAAEAAPADSAATAPPAESPATGPVPADPPAVKPATQADVKVGAAVSDSAGVSFGKVDAIDAQGVTVSSGTIKAKLPLSSVGVGPNGLVISVTKAEFEAAAKKAGG